MDFSFMDAEDLEILVKITEIDIKLGVGGEAEKSESGEEETHEGPMDQGLDYEENFIWPVLEPAVWIERRGVYSSLSTDSSWLSSEGNEGVCSSEYRVLEICTEPPKLSRLGRLKELTPARPGELRGESLDQPGWSMLNQRQEQAQRLRSTTVSATVSLTVRNFCSRAKNPHGQYGQHGHAPGQPTVYTVTWP